MMEADQLSAQIKNLGKVVQKLSTGSAILSMSQTLPALSGWLTFEVQV